MRIMVRFFDSFLARHWGGHDGDDDDAKGKFYFNPWRSKN
jgi:hypothetical protein